MSLFEITMQDQSMTMQDQSMTMQDQSMMDDQEESSCTVFEGYLQKEGS